MGINKLFQVLEDFKSTNIRMGDVISNRRVGVDLNYLIHQKFMNFCAAELLRGDTKMCQGIVAWAKKLTENFNCELIFVLDGGEPPAKAGEAAGRSLKRHRHGQLAAELVSFGKDDLATKIYSQAMTLESDWLIQIVDALRQSDLLAEEFEPNFNHHSSKKNDDTGEGGETRRRPCSVVVAPFEGEAQICYMQRKGWIHTVYSGDSDVFLYNPNGTFVTEIDFKKKTCTGYMAAKRAPKQQQQQQGGGAGPAGGGKCPLIGSWPRSCTGDIQDFDVFALACVMCGCDYLGGKRNFHAIAEVISTARTVDEALVHLANDYLYRPLIRSSAPQRALYAFMYARVFDFETRSVVTMFGAEFPPLTAGGSSTAGGAAVSPLPPPPAPVFAEIVGTPPPDPITFCVKRQGLKKVHRTDVTREERAELEAALNPPPIGKDTLKGQEMTCQLCGFGVFGSEEQNEQHKESAYHQGMDELDYLRFKKKTPIRDRPKIVNRLVPTRADGAGVPPTGPLPFFTTEALDSSSNTTEENLSSNKKRKNAANTSSAAWLPLWSQVVGCERIVPTVAPPPPLLQPRPKPKLRTFTGTVMSVPRATFAFVRFNPQPGLPEGVDDRDGCFMPSSSLASGSPSLRRGVQLSCTLERSHSQQGRWQVRSAKPTAGSPTLSGSQRHAAPSHRDEDILRNDRRRDGDRDDRRRDRQDDYDARDRGGHSRRYPSPGRRREDRHYESPRPDRCSNDRSRYYYNVNRRDTRGYSPRRDASRLAGRRRDRSWDDRDRYSDDDDRETKRRRVR